MDIASLIGGLGIGSVLTLFLKEYFDNKKILSKRAFEGSVQYLQQKERPWHVDVNGHSHISRRKPWSSWSLSYQARG